MRSQSSGAHSRDPLASPRNDGFILKPRFACYVRFRNHKQATAAKAGANKRMLQ